MCPNCKKVSLCGCKSCKSGLNGKMPRQRTQRFVQVDFIKCPYCRAIKHSDAWLDAEYENILYNSSIEGLEDVKKGNVKTTEEILNGFKTPNNQ